MLALCVLVIAALLRDRTSLLHGRWGIPAGIMLLALTVALAVALYRTYARIQPTSGHFPQLLRRAQRARFGEGPDAMRALSHAPSSTASSFSNRSAATGHELLRAEIGHRARSPRRARARPLAGERGGPGRGNARGLRQDGRCLPLLRINSGVVELARSEFTFLKDSRAKVEVALGDARLSLSASLPRISTFSRSTPSRATRFPCICSQWRPSNLPAASQAGRGPRRAHLQRYLDLVPVVQQAAAPSFARAAPG